LNSNGEEVAMTDSNRPTHEVAGATPPGRGEQTHEVMQADASRPITGPGSTNTLAAGGGLEVPGREPHPHALTHETLAHEPSPGERDPGTLTMREPGAIGTASGAQLPQGDARAWLSDDDAEEMRRDGGGLSNKRTR
jgi:hypothetical protein